MAIAKISGDYLGRWGGTVVVRMESPSVSPLLRVVYPYAPPLGVLPSFSEDVSALRINGVYCDRVTDGSIVEVFLGVIETSRGPYLWDVPGDVSYPVGCLVYSSSPDVDRRMGVVLACVTSQWEFRRILWTDGRVTLEGVIYLGTFYEVVQGLGDVV